MNRRTFILSGITLTAAATAGWMVLPNNKSDLSLQKLIDDLLVLQDQQITFGGDWNSFQTFTHLAQSVEYSMLGYPEHRSDVFKTTIGKAAFNVFSSKGYMKHNLLESIPGAPALTDKGETGSAIKRLISALQQFEGYEEPLAEHFAYGKLSKKEYALAHVLHVKDHFSLMQTT